MKVAVSIPDDLFDRVDALAVKIAKSRSAIYAEALRVYVSRPTDDDITAQLNAMIDEVGQPDPLVQRAGSRTAAEHTEW